MRFGSLFAGIGGFDLGLERAGMECAWQVEIDDYCNRVLEKHWPEVRRYGDIRTVGKKELETVDLICGGFPCQPYSVAGKRRGAEDDRNLWPEYLRIVRELRPAWVLGENVPGIVSMYLDTVLSDLEGEGYTCWTFNIPAIAFDAPHRRERIFVVCYAEHYGQSAPEVKGCFAQGSNGSKTRKNATSQLEGSGIEPWDVAHAERARLAIREGQAAPPVFGTELDSGTDVPYPTSIRSQGQGELGFAGNPKENGKGQAIDTINECQRTFWTVEPNVGRVADGVPNRVDRLRTLGNAVVPQVVEWIGRRIMEAENEKTLPKM